jgi:hypothetical protein
MELNAHPMRLDMDWCFWHKASEKGLKCAINPDAHSVADLRYYQGGVNIARKGWLEKKHIINTLPLSSLKKFLRGVKSWFFKLFFAKWETIHLSVEDYEIFINGLSLYGWLMGLCGSTPLRL